VGSIYSSHIKKSRWGIFQRKSDEATIQVQWTSLESGENSLKVSQGPDKSDGGL
jgi:hypothetical protein